MKRLITLFLVLIMTSAFTQQQTARKAFLGENGEVLVEEVLLGDELLLEPAKEDPVYDQLPGWPKRVASHPNFKNFRGATLVDLTGDGRDEILVASFSTLSAFRGTGDLLWSLPLTGTATYPPSVADVTGDGEFEIVQLTGGVPNNGRVYLLDKEGNILPGWPVSINNNWLLSAPTLADLNDDGQMEVIFGVRTVNQIHILKADGTNFNENWPVTLSSIPAVTPSVGDINNDGTLNIIAGASDGTLYAFNPDATILPGFPVNPGNVGLSYQSPLLTDFDGDGHLSIVGATHGNSPQYYVRNSDGDYREGWPKAVPGGGWTYHPPTLADISGNGAFEILTAKPIGETPDDMLFGYDADGNMLDNFPVSKSGGLESFISVADVDGDGQHDLVFGSNLMVENKGFIHAWKTDGSGQLPGFPLRPDGFTFMNGANLGDVNGDGLLDLVAVSYEQTFSSTDSTVINVYNLGISLEDADVLFGTYKGDNTRAGLMKKTEPDTVYYEITFNLDLSYVEDYFDSEVDDFFITGSMIEWTEPGTLPEQQLLEQVEGSMIFTRTFELMPGEYAYKYFLNAGWDGGEWQGGDDRIIEVADEDIVVNDSWTGLPGGQIAYDVIIDVNPAEGGSVEGAGEYVPNANVFLTAEAAEDYTFLHWLDGDEILSTEHEYHFFMPRADFSLSAAFQHETGVNELSENNLIVFPNPAQDRFTVRAEHLIEYISVSDITGKRIVNVPAASQEVLVDSPFQPGIYIVKVVTDEGVFVSKVQIE